MTQWAAALTFLVGLCYPHHMGRKAEYLDGLRVCTQCKVPKPDDDFSLRTDKGKTQYRLSRCKPCEAARHRGRWNERRDWIAEYKLAKGCADCGYRERAIALDFDHLPGSSKVLNISYMVQGYARSRIIEEIAKCEVVCANCHRVRTEERRNGAKLVGS